MHFFPLAGPSRNAVLFLPPCSPLLLCSSVTARNEDAKESTKKSMLLFYRPQDALLPNSTTVMRGTHKLNPTKENAIFQYFPFYCNVLAYDLGGETKTACLGLYLNKMSNIKGQ